MFPLPCMLSISTSTYTLFRILFTSVYKGISTFESLLHVDLKRKTLLNQSLLYVCLFYQCRLPVTNSTRLCCFCDWSFHSTLYTVMHFALLWSPLKTVVHGDIQGRNVQSLASSFGTGTIEVTLPASQKVKRRYL